MVARSTPQNWPAVALPRCGASNSFSGAFLIPGMEVFVTIMHSAPDPNERARHQMTFELVMAG
jgi:hypothetical protein